MNFIRSTMSKFRIVQSITLVFSIIFYLMGMLVTPLTAGAAGTIDGLGGKDNIDLTAYTFDEICSKNVGFSKTFNELLSKSKEGVWYTNDDDKIRRGMYYNFKSSQEYSTWLADALKYIKYTEDGNRYFFTPEPSSSVSNVTEYTTEDWATYNTCSNKFTRIMARGAGEYLTNDVFGQEFDPTNAVTLAAMKTFTMVCNTIFNTVAKALMLLFLVQTGFDVMYLTLPFTQGFLAPTNASAGSGSAGVTQGKKYALRFNIVSNEAVDANNRSSTGSVGSNGASGGGFLQTNIFMRYIIARAPLILLAFTYFVLVATNVWTSLISSTTSLITGIFYGL